MSFEKEIEEHELRTKKVLAMGGEKRVERQRAMGRLNARQRIDYLMDPESFLEIGRFARIERLEDRENTAADG